MTSEAQPENRPARPAGPSREGVAGAASKAMGDLPTNPVSASGWSFLGEGRVRWDAPLRLALGLIAGALAVGALAATGFLADTAASLVEMGFDPDRGQLLTALTAAAIGAALASTLAGRRAPGVLLGLAATLAVFGATFLQETSAALASSGDQGRFDPIGWTFAAVTLLASGLLVGWAAGTLALDVRGGLIATGRATGGWLRRRPPARGKWKPLQAAAMVALLAIALPTLGIMVNYSPDATMRQGAPLGVPLVGGGQGANGGGANGGGSGSADAGASGGAASSPAAPPLPSPGEAGLVTGPFPGSEVTAGAFDPGRPWLAWRPSGPSSIVQAALPAPWTGGTTEKIYFDLYLPAGYSASGARRYPTVYVTPWGFPHWEDSVHIRELLDALIAGGQIVPQIFVFISQFGAPYPASECADSLDGRQHIDTWIGATLVPWMDGHYRTIADRRARSLLGYSEGGYCATTLLLHHADLFGQAAAMSGYYVAGPHNNQTVNSWRVFGDDPTAKANASPIVLVDRLTPDMRHSIFIALNGQQSEPFYGPQYRAFADRLARDHVPMALLPTSRVGHSWQEVRDDLGPMLVLLAGHLVTTGVFA